MNKHIPGLAKPAIAITAIFLSAILVSCCFYLFSAYRQLVAWYTGLGACFYKNKVWSTDFFTPRIKSDGNMYCIIAMIIAGSGAFYSLKRIKNWRKHKMQPVALSFDTKNMIPVILCLVTAILLWCWGNKLAMPASDEVFSAVNVAGIHPFQAVSYYMLPNNHLFFNLLNNLVFHSFSDKVVTGRVISLIAYCGFIIAVFFWFTTIFANRWIAVLVSITLSLQFIVWGFSFQARGYELYLLAEWGMFISLFCYITSGNQRWLYLNTLCCAIGYFCLPSFLYFHAAQLVFMLLYALFYRKRERAFWQFQAVTVLLTYLFYLPALCFSGLDAIIHNNYVVSMGAFQHTGRMPFIYWMFPYFHTYITHIFSGLHWNSIPISVILLFLPLALLFRRKNKALVLFGMFYLSMWVTFFLIAIFMKKLPFERNLTGHYSITLAGVILVFYWLVDMLAGKEKTGIVKWGLFAGVLVLFAVHFLRTNELLLKDTLYEYDVNTVYTEKCGLLGLITPGRTVAVSDEDFLPGYICRKKGCIVSKCPNGHEMYYLKEAFETIPQPYADNYTLVNNFYGDEVYKLK